MEKLTEDIVFYGLWQHSQQIDNEVQLITPEREQVKALKAQLNFRRQVFKQVANKTTYSFSKRQDGKSVPLTVEELAANLKTLVKSALAENVEEDSVLVGKRVPGYPTWFNVVYEGDQAVYTYQLLEDQEKGTLEVLPN